jgi:general secretion pathway protein K
MQKRLLLRQRGVAVVTALLLTTLAITIVASLFWQQQVQVRSIENQRLQLQKQWILRGALDWARLILREDAKFSSVDTLEEPWAVPLSETRLDQYVENGKADADAADASLSGTIVDAQSRYNLTNLSVNGKVNQAEVAAFERLLTNASLNPALARATANAVADSQPKPQTPGVSDSDGPRPMALTQVDDLLSVAGFTPAALEKIREFVILLPRITPVNVNTAPAEVLAARIDTLSLTDANALVASRKKTIFRDIADLSQRLPGKPLAPSSSELSVMTNFFLINGKVRMNRAGLEVQALVERNGATTRLIWIREN